MDNIFYKPRKFNNIKLWENITEKEWNNTEWQIKNSITDINTLSKVIKLNNYQYKEIERTINTLKNQGKEPFRITPYYASLMQEDPFHPVLSEGEDAQNKLDPIFWQSVPTPANLLFPNTGKETAMSEGSRSYGAAYQRYPNRVALFVGKNTSCASYCVHCQRAKSLDSKADVSKMEIDKGLFYIGYNKNINEVLVTGGDALRISKKLLVYVLEELSRIQHLRVIRIATRVPVVLPMAITDELLDTITRSVNKYNNGYEKYVYFMTHVNHHHEITETFALAVKKIRNHGFTIRNQTVLLNHVNNNFRTLAETFRKMLWVGIHPYYLLQCHKEKGIVHFILPVQLGKIYIKNFQGWLSGITIPKYAANIEGGGGKVILMPSGHDTMNVNVNIDEKISESYATVYTWDDRKIEYYESLGRSTEKEFEEANNIMEKFIGRSGVFVPKIIITDSLGNYVKTTNRETLPQIEKTQKPFLLDYSTYKNGLPITNPYDIKDELDRAFIAAKTKNSD